MADNNKTGALFKNDKQGVETRPDYTGTCNIDGRDFYIAGWKKVSKNGMTYLSLAFKDKNAPQQQASSSGASSTPPASNSAADDNDIPF